jgi:signal transduction histidine kinase
VLEEKRQRLEIIVPETAVCAWVDPRRITQIVANLVGNASKHTGEETTIEVSLSQKPSEIILSVTDTGAGIDSSVLPHIFEPFFTKRTTYTSGSGLGIGLTLTKGLVDMHGGAIAVSSGGQGKGVRFTITLPVAGRQRRRTQKREPLLCTERSAIDE